MNTANKCFLATPATFEPKWWVVDATDQVLGRLAARIAQILMGKHRPTYTPYMDTGDFVIVLNSGKIRVTGDKLDTKQYMRYTYYPGGHRYTPLRTSLQRDPSFALREAVRRMLPKSKLAAKMLSKLKMYAGDQHPHQAQMPEALTTR